MTENEADLIIARHAPNWESKLRDSSTLFDVVRRIYMKQDHAPRRGTQIVNTLCKLLKTKKIIT